MAYYTKIPESNIPNALASRIGKVSGTITSKATNTLNECYKQLDRIAKDAYNEIQQRGNTIIASKAGDFTQGIAETKALLGQQAADKLKAEGFKSLKSYQPVISPYRQLSQVKNKINSVKASINQINGMINSIRATASTIKVPIQALNAASQVIVYLPMGFWSLWSFMTAFESDLLVMLRELIAQISETCDALEYLCTVSASSLDVVNVQVSSNEQFCQTLQMDSDFYDALAYTSGNDSQTLVRLGIIDSNGRSIFNRIAPVLGSNQPTTLMFGNYNLDTGSNIVQNYLKISEPDTVVEIPNQGSGDWISTVYRFSESIPDTPTSRNREPEGWTIQCPSETENWWKSRATISKSGQAGIWTKPEKLLESCESVGILLQQKGTLVKILGINSEDYSEGLLQINAEQGVEMLNNMLYRLDRSSISKDLKDTLKTALQQFIPSSSAEESEKEYKLYTTSSNGDVYTIECVEDKNSPSIATRRYAVAKTVDDIIVLEGNKTFSPDIELILQELKVKLEQLLS